MLLCRRGQRICPPALQHLINQHFSEYLISPQSTRNEVQKATGCGFYKGIVWVVIFWMSTVALRSQEVLSSP